MKDFLCDSLSNRTTWRNCKILNIPFVVPLRKLEIWMVFPKFAGIPFYFLCEICIVEGRSDLKDSLCILCEFGKLEVFPKFRAFVFSLYKLKKWKEFQNLKDPICSFFVKFRNPEGFSEI